MGYDDVPIDGDQRHGEQGHGQQPVAEHGEQPAQEIAVRPRPFPERGGGQRQVEASEQQIRTGQINDEDRSRVAGLAAA